MTKPLEGLTVVEAAEGIAAPYCGRCLADAGASVIKVEPIGGDPTRQWAPAWGASSVPFAALNHGKSSISLDHRAGPSAEVRDILRGAADMIVADDSAIGAWLSSGPMNGSAVECVVNGFGRRGPWSGRPGSELTAQLYSEMTTSLGEIGSPPLRLGTDIVSMTAGIFASQGLAAALVAGGGRNGSRLTVSLLGSALTMRSTLWGARSRPDEWWGFHLDSYVKPPFWGYRCRDGLVFAALRMPADVDWEALVRDFGMEWWKDDPRAEMLRTDSLGPTSRYGHEVHDLWERAFGNMTVDEVIAKVEAAGGNGFPMLDHQALLQDEQIAALDCVSLDDGVPVIRSPWTFDGEGKHDYRACHRVVVPDLGADTDEVLEQIGFGADEIARLRRIGVLH